MKQTSFLDHVPTVTHYAAPIARTTDPVTSHEAAAEVPGDAEDIAYDAAVLVANTHGSFTALEMGERGSRIPGERGRTYSAETIRKRYTNLLAQKRIIATGQKRRCLISGKNAHTYRLRLPSDVDPAADTDLEAQGEV